MLKMCLFCTFLVDLRHKNPALKTELAATVENQIRFASTAVFLLLSGSDSSESRNVFSYCRFRVNLVDVTVQSHEMLVPTAVSQYFSAQIAVARAGFAQFYCYRTTGKRQKLQYFLCLFLFLLSIQKNHTLKRQYRKNLLASVLSFHVHSTVAMARSELCTAKIFHGGRARILV